MDKFPFTRDLVLIGGGHTHALVLRKWGMRPLAGVRVTLINPGPTAAYSGMLPGFVAGHYSRDDLDIDLVKLARFADARFINGAVTAIDRGAKTVTVPGRPPIGYDALAIDVGITSEMPDLPGFAAHGVPAKPLGAFARAWDLYRATAKAPQIAVIGGGVAGAELALAMAHALRDKAPKVHVIDRGRALSALGYKARQKMLAALTGYGIEVIEPADVTQVFAEGVVLKDGRLIQSDFTTGAAGAKPHDWVAGTGLDLRDGFITVNAQMQSSDPAIFAVGDCAHMAQSPRPKAGVYAVRQAPVLYDNLRGVLSGGALRDYIPQRDYLKLISLGGKSALAEKFGTAWQGSLLWRLKDGIDRKFMTQFATLPAMPMPVIPKVAALGLADALGDKPMCGGCGAKVGRGALQQVLGDGFGDDAGEVQPGQVISTDHLRALTADPVLMTRIAAIHALGDIWAMGSKPQAATASIILPRMSAALQQRTMAEIMATATEVMKEAGARIAGGHSSLGDELTIGFTLTGLTDRPITLAGAQAGDALILTKPIGSGVIMAAEMAGQARGADVIACLDLMTQPQGEAAAILQNAHAMTDVTGFGLLGHLRGICDASGTGAALEWGKVPVMQGAADLAAQGIRSSLFPDNQAGAGAINGPVPDLAYDPQTAGGLLACVAADSADDLLAQLKAAGYPAAIIGQVTATSGITCR
ncbi:MULTISPECIES: selenide, water dikinase SelD [unclassified Yoonia]|uniref:selenide, water dikinase SelD n=1 Tax=unclassified Yoonia TaxID=2629118 RepID=UPI002AFF206B|nr:MULTISPECIES: selenide, water dikinase SelD [unclassified Yoonia]